MGDEIWYYCEDCNFQWKAKSVFIKCAICGKQNIQKEVNGDWKADGKNCDDG